VVGVLGLGSGHTARRWGSRDIEALTSFGKLASIALDNARLIDVAQRGALYDPTTGLPNRELLTDRISHALAGHRADDSESIAVVLLGLDRFKVINESLGHAIGDRLLIAVGQRLVNGLRPGDTSRVWAVTSSGSSSIPSPMRPRPEPSPTGSSKSCVRRSH
jgi:GGDEF domain-containing protein